MDTPGATSSTEIFVLVLFTDEIFQICKPSDVRAFKKKCPAVTYTDGKKYTARILALHENRAVLEEIQKCLEEEESSVFFKTIEQTGNKLIYTDAVNKHKKHRDASKLYLDSAVLVSRGTNSKDYIFSLPEQDKRFFQIQSDLVESKITRFEIHVEPSRDHLCFESDIDRGTVVQKDDLVENLEGGSNANNKKISIEHSPTRLIPRGKMSVEYGSSCMIPDETTSIAHSPTRQNICDEILLDGNATSQNQNKVSVNNNRTSAILNKNIEHAFNDQIPGEKEAKMEHVEHDKNANVAISERKIAAASDAQVLDVTNLPEPNGTGRVCDQKEATAEYVSVMQEPIENNITKSEVDMPNEKYDNVARSECNIADALAAQILDVTKLPELNSSDRVCDQKEATEPVPIMHGPVEKKMTKRDTEILDEKNANMAMFEHKIANAQMTEMRVSGNEILESNDSTKSVPRFVSYPESHTQIAQPLDKIVEGNVEKLVEENRVFDDTHIDENSKISDGENLNQRVYQSDNEDEKQGHRIDENCNFFAVNNLNEISGRMSVDESIHENLRVDENCNVSATNDFNQEIAVDNSVVEGEIQKDFQIILGEIGMTTSMTENLCVDPCQNSLYEHIFPPYRQGKHDVEEPVEVAGGEVPYDVAFRPEPVSDSFAVEVSGAANSCINDSPNVGESRLKPTIVDNVILTRYKLDLREKCSISLSDDIPIPAGSSTFLEAPNPESYRAYSDEKSSGDSKVAKSDEETARGSDSESSRGSEYVPSAADSSSDGDSDVEEKAEKSTSKKSRNVSSSLNITLGPSKQGASAPDDTELEVKSSKSAMHTKKNFCLYCQTLQSKLARHLELAHATEDDVKKFTALPPKNLERLQIIATIRKNGNHVYNTDRRFNKGELLVVRRPQERMKKSAKDFVPCGNCCGQYSRAVIRHHFKKCTKKSGRMERLVMVKGRKVGARIHEIANDLVRTHIFPYMREDAVVRGIRYDKLIILYANKQCEKYGLHQHHYQMIRGRLRLLGRFVLAVKERNSAIKEFADVFQPRHYDDAVKAVKIVAGFDEISRVFAHPAVASNLGTLLKYAGQIQRSEYIKEERAHDQKRVEDFLKLHSEDYGTSVNRAVLETQMQNNRRKKVVLPNLDDITKLHNYLNAKRQTLYETLDKEFTQDTWRHLAEVALISLQLFNRRRAGEIERVYVEDFNSFQGIDQVADKEMYATLSKHGQALARKYVRFMIRGKLGRGVPVLVPANILDCLVLICKHRSDAGVSENNPYLFGLPSKDRDRVRYLRACDLLRQFAEQCGADVPTTLRGTQLRKHVATKCVSLNLSENEVSNLANFLGHADQIHKKIYRQPDVQNDIVKISQLLEMAQGTKDSPAGADDSSSEEEEANSTTARPIEAEDSSSSEADGTSGAPERSRHGKKSTDADKSRKSNPAARRGNTHRRWTDIERSTVLSAFQNIMRGGKMPTGEQIQKLINSNACLEGREVAQVRTWLHIQKKKT